ncbi:MAG: RNA polymerase subunit sigma-70 [Alphaproteobacteria bacterium]|nr:RNA polymerase subunit sigma-70 [Alphaproteobacteria bacterium]
MADRQGDAISRNVRRVAHLDLMGAGQVTVAGNYAYIGHITNKERLGTTIVDVSDPASPRVIATIELNDPDSHSHKARVAGDLMIVNSERNNSGIGRKAEQLPAARENLRGLLGREPSHAELADKLGVEAGDIPLLEEAEKHPYDKGGFRLYDISDKVRPRPLAFQHTGGIGVHRFDMDEHYAYISTEMAGFNGNILVIYDIRDPAHPAEVSRWWMPGQHLAGGETPRWPGRQNRLHHALRFGNEMWAGCWHGGLRVIDVSDIARPTTIASYNYHPPFPEPTHTVMPVPNAAGGRRIALAIDEEDQFYGAAEAEARRGRPHAALWTFDMTDWGAVQPLAMFEVSELDSPYSRTPGGRFGAHQFAEHMDDSLVYCAWFSGGLRVVDVADPRAPREVASFIPEPCGGRPSPQSNDVEIDGRGLIYLVDRNVGFDILELRR